MRFGVMKGQGGFGARCNDPWWCGCRTREGRYCDVVRTLLIEIGYALLPGIPRS